MAPVYLSNAKKKIIFGEGNFLFTKDKKYQHLTHAEKIMKYTNDLELPIKNESKRRNVKWFLYRPWWNCLFFSR